MDQAASGTLLSDTSRAKDGGWLAQEPIDPATLRWFLHDGKAEQQRLDQWLQSMVIEDMWFVLGASARRNSTPEFKELRKRM
jgi:hypothetical protein